MPDAHAHAHTHIQNGRVDHYLTPPCIGSLLHFYVHCFESTHNNNNTTTPPQFFFLTCVLIVPL